MTHATPIIDSHISAAQDRLREVVSAHFDPRWGSAYWLDRARRLGIDPLTGVRGLEDLAVFGQMTAEDLEARPLVDYIPKRFHDRMDRFIVGQTGGTTGGGTWTAYRDDEFNDGFVLPFIEAANHVGFPAGLPWLYVGPSGPHIIGKVVKHLANSLGSPDPFSVDFDPRWAKRLAEGSLAQNRYTQHVVEQAVRVIESQAIGVLFTTPIVLKRLADSMTPAQRERVRGVHYGGTALAADDLHLFQSRLFPNAVHLSGYGNTLFGCCLELCCEPGRTPEYFPFGHRLIFEVIDEHGVALPPGRAGRVRFTRLDESFLIVRMIERDQAVLVPPPRGVPEGFVSAGLREPRPFENERMRLPIGLY